MVEWSPEDRLGRWIERVIEGNIGRVMEAPEGMRNDTLNRAAFILGKAAAAGWVSPEVMAVQLLQACEATGLLKEDGPRACGATIASGLKRGQADGPLSPPAGLEGVTPNGFGVVQLSPEAVAAAMRAEEERRILALSTADAAEGALNAREYWEQVTSSLLRHSGATRELARRGIDLETAATYGVGYDDFPLGDAPEKYGPPGRRPSLVLPWLSLDRPGHYDAIQYRHLDGGAPKVHWHHALHSAKVFNANALSHPHSDELYVVEGALAALTLISAGITSTVALPQLRPRLETIEALAARMGAFERVRWLCDKGAHPIWRSFAAKVPDGRGAAVALPMDPDEFLLACDGDVDSFWRATRYSAVA